MTVTVLNTTEEALSFTPEVRGCYKSRDFFFKYMTYDQGFRYSMNNCLYESVLEVILSDCKCIPSFVNFNVSSANITQICRGQRNHS